MLDWVIRGGTVIDGSGSAPFRADIGICGGKIAAVGSCGEAAQTLDAAGRYVTPGFLDIHRHGDAAVFRPGFGRAELRQGLTTIVNGNCGLSLAPFGAAHRAELRRYLGAITGDIDPAIPTESMAAYLAALRARPLPLHVGMLVGGGTVRADRCGYAPGDADEALPELHRRLERALADGALGVSLGLGYAPECFYTPDGLLRALAPLQGSGIPICVHMREEGDMVCDALREMLRAARLRRPPVPISHLKAMGPRNWRGTRGWTSRATSIPTAQARRSCCTCCRRTFWQAGRTPLLPGCATRPSGTSCASASPAAAILTPSPRWSAGTISA